MTRKRYYIAGIVLIAFALLFIVAGVLLFIYSPAPDATGYYDAKEAMYMSGIIFSFIIGLVSMCVGVAILITGIMKNNY